MHSEWVKALVLLEPKLCGRDLSIEAQPEIEGWFRWVQNAISSGLSFEELCSELRGMIPEASDDIVRSSAQSIKNLDGKVLEVVFGKPMFYSNVLDAQLRNISCPTCFFTGSGFSTRLFAMKMRRSFRRDWMMQRSKRSREVTCFILRGERRYLHSSEIFYAQPGRIRPNQSRGPTAIRMNARRRASFPKF